MKKPPTTVKWLLLFIIALAIAPIGCRAQPTLTPVEYSLPELKYQLISNFGDVFWCDSDLYPIARPGQEETNALEQFLTIQANEAEFSAILQHLGLPHKSQYSDEEKLQVYREHKKLTVAIQMTSFGDIYNFTLRVGEGQGERIEGTITSSGKMKILKREPSFNICPICLAKGTIIDTLDGPVPVEQLHKGIAVWTIDDSGKRAPAVVVETTMTSVPASFQVTRVILSDGRAVIASPGHPTAEGRALGEYKVGDILDVALIVAVEHVTYDGDTYDLLPSGATGLYWANGVLLKSTLATN